MTGDRKQANQPLPFRGGQRDLAARRLVAAGGESRPCAMPHLPTPTPPLKGRGSTPQDTDRRSGAAPSIGRGKNWGLSASDLEELQRRARHMRNNPTEPEKRLWRHLSNGQMDGHKFRRQQVIGWFIADLFDGDTHHVAKDRVRDNDLAQRGYRVLRVTNEDVMHNMDGVLRHLSEALRQAERPHPNPSPEREGLKEGTSLEGSAG